jgi:hypothetical protein
MTSTITTHFTWFISMVCSASPRVKMMAWFWFSGFPSPNFAGPGNFMRYISFTGYKSVSTIEALILTMFLVCNLCICVPDHDCPEPLLALNRRPSEPCHHLSLQLHQCMPHANQGNCGLKLKLITLHRRKYYLEWIKQIEISFLLMEMSLLSNINY